MDKWKLEYLYKRVVRKPWWKCKEKLNRDASLLNLAIIESIRPSHLLQTCPSRCVSLGEPRPLEPRGPCLQHGLVKRSAFHTWQIAALYAFLAIVRNDNSSPGSSRGGASSPGSRPFAAADEPSGDDSRQILSPAQPQILMKV